MFGSMSMLEANLSGINSRTITTQMLKQRKRENFLSRRLGGPGPFIFTLALYTEASTGSVDIRTDADRVGDLPGG